MPAVNTINSIIATIETRLNNIAPLRITAVPGTLNPPCAFVRPPESVDFDSAYQRGLDEVTLVIDVLVQAVSEREARTNLCEYMNPTGSLSVKTAVDDDQYRVVNINDVGIRIVNNVQYWGFSATVLVLNG